MDWIESFVTTAILSVFFFWLFGKLENTIKLLNERIEIQNQRIDQLYQMFVDLLKEKR